MQKTRWQTLGAARRTLAIVSGLIFLVAIGFLVYAFLFVESHLLGRAIVISIALSVFSAVLVSSGWYLTAPAKTR